MEKRKFQGVSVSLSLRIFAFLLLPWAIVANLYDFTWLLSYVCNRSPKICFLVFLHIQHY